MFFVQWRGTNILEECAASFAGYKRSRISLFYPEDQDHLILQNVVTICQITWHHISENRHIYIWLQTMQVQVLWTHFVANHYR